MNAEAKAGSDSFNYKGFKSLIIQVGKFMLVGVLNTGIDAATYFLLTRWMGFNYLPVLAKGIAYVAGMINSFFLNRKWTFKSEGSLWRAAGLFTLTHIAALGINTGAMAFSLEVAGFSEFFSLALATAASFAWNFVLNKVIVFKD